MRKQGILKAPKGFTKLNRFSAWLSFDGVG